MLVTSPEAGGAMAVPEPARVAAVIDLLTPRYGGRAQVVSYRLLRRELARQRGLAVAGSLADDSLTERALALLANEGDAGDDVRDLAELHLGLLHPTHRKAAGAWFTPQALVEHLLDETLEPALDEARRAADVRVLDPACGSGLFLVAALHRLVRRGVSAERALRHGLHGIELDAAAAELTRLSLWIAAVDTGADADVDALQVRAGDALGTAQPETYDVVVGNPPFLNRLERRTALEPAVGRRLATVSQGAVRAYTDVSAIFLLSSVSWVRPGGLVGLVQPQSVLAARDAAGVRRHVTSTCSLDSLWASSEPVFDAGVLTCAPVLRKGGEQADVRRRHGRRFDPLPSAEPGDLTGTWSHLVADALGVPRVRLGSRPAPLLGDVARCTADFRDQYYGLDGHVREAVVCPGGAPLVTTGLVDPAVTRWGGRPTRFLKRTWTAPVVDLTSLAAQPALHAWARNRLVPKVLVASQGKVVEAVVDEHGEWLPSVPVVTVVPRDVTLWHLLAVLLAPPVAAHAASTYAGAGLTMRAVKLSAKQVAELPLPTDEASWGRAAACARQAQHDPEGRMSHLEEMGRLMCEAYGVSPDEVLPWWYERLPRRAAPTTRAASRAAR
jgi:hypothetical protein